MPYLQLSIPSGTKIGHTVEAASGKGRVTLLADDRLRIADAGGREYVCSILSANSEDGLMTMFVYRPARPSD